MALQIGGSEHIQQAHMKYLDAFKTAEKDYTANFHTGRLKLQLGEVKDAALFLQNAVGLKPTSCEAR